jgi:four helix bundle protein
MADRTNFERLDVYRLSEKLAEAIWAAVGSWDAFSRGTIGRQMVRAADSTGANIAEGTGRGSFQDNRRFVRNPRGSLNETRHWLRRAHRRGLIDSAFVTPVKPILDELSPKLNAYLRSIGPVPGPQRSESARATDNGQRTTDRE